MANKKTFVGNFSKVEHCGQNDGDGEISATCMKLEKKERVSMREGKKRESRGREGRRMRSPKMCIQTQRA